MQITETDAQGADLVTRRGVSLSPEDDRIAREMAERHHGGNISRLIRRLLRDAWAIESARESEKPQVAA